MSLNGVDFIGENEVGLEYTYYNNPTAFRGVYPTGGPILGGTLMTFQGSGFGSFGVQASIARCVWGPAAVPTIERTMTTPVELADDGFVCATSAVEGFSGAFYFVAVKLSLNGVEYGAPQFVRFYEQPRLFLDLVPVTGGPISGGTVITLGGFGFVNFDSEVTGVTKARCRWGQNATAVVPIALFSDSIVCATSPRENAADVTLRVSTNGQDFVDTFKVFRYYDVKVTSINPAGSPLPGRRNVIVKGSGFLGFMVPGSQTPEDRVRIRLRVGQSLTVKEMTDVRFAFDAPPGIMGRYRISITLNLLDWDESGWDGTQPVVYDYYDTLPTGTVPTGGHARGGTLVTVFGSGFFAVDPSAGLFRVKFGSAEPLHARNYSDTAAIVSTAPTPSSQQAVTVSLNSFDFAGGQPPVVYKFYDHNISSMRPSGGPVLGGTVVTFDGNDFDAFGEPSLLRCRFGTRTVPAVLGSVAYNSTVCVSPPHSTIGGFEEVQLADIDTSALAGEGGAEAFGGGNDAAVNALHVLMARVCCIEQSAHVFNQDGVRNTQLHDLATAIFATTAGSLVVSEPVAMSLDLSAAAGSLDLSQIVWRVELMTPAPTNRSLDARSALNGHTPIPIAMQALGVLRTPHSFDGSTALEDELRELYAPNSLNTSLLVDIELPMELSGPLGGPLGGRLLYRRLLHNGTEHEDSTTLCAPGDLEPSIATLLPLAAAPTASSNMSAALVLGEEAAVVAPAGLCGQRPHGDIGALRAPYGIALANLTRGLVQAFGGSAGASAGASADADGGSNPPQAGDGRRLRDSMGHGGGEGDTDLPGGSDREVTIALNGRDFVSAERDISVCAPTEMRCAATANDPIHDGRDDLTPEGIVHYCRNESTCAQVGASCSTIPEDSLCGGWKPVPPAPLCRDGVRCTPAGHIACAPLQMCTYCSRFTICTIYHNPPAIFRYYQANVLSARPSGGFLDGGTTVTLVGTGFNGFNNNPNNTLAGFGDLHTQVDQLRALEAVVQSPPHPSYNPVAAVPVDDWDGLSPSRRLAEDEGASLVVSLSISLNGIDFDLAAEGVNYRYYTHSTRRLEPFGGPSIGGTAVSVVGEGFDGYDGLASSARCLFGTRIVAVTTLEDDSVCCVSPAAIRRLTEDEEVAAEAARQAREETGASDPKEVPTFDANGTQLPFLPPPPFMPSPPPMPSPPLMPPPMPPLLPRGNDTHNATFVGGGGGAVVDLVSMEVTADPVFGTTYAWFSGNLTDLHSLWLAPLRVAINQVDFRGNVFFRYYHQVVHSIAVTNSSEWGMYSEDGSAEFAGGDPEGGYQITVIGSGFGGYDGNSSTVRVRFATILLDSKDYDASGNGGCLCGRHSRRRQQKRDSSSSQRPCSSW